MFQEITSNYIRESSKAKTYYLCDEEQRGISENLTEEGLALFDVLTKPNVKLTRKEREKVKAVAKGTAENPQERRLGAGLVQIPGNTGSRGIENSGRAR